MRGNAFWILPGSSRDDGGRRRPSSPRGWRLTSDSWRWDGLDSRCASMQRSRTRSGGMSTGSIRRNSSCRRIRGEDLRPLARIVSGGELSRMMLALKTMAVADGAAKTLIFDEVDAGIGGEVAEVVGHKLQQLGQPVSGDLHHAPATDSRAGVDALSPGEERFAGVGR